MVASKQEFAKRVAQDLFRYMARARVLAAAPPRGCDGARGARACHATQRCRARALTARTTRSRGAALRRGCDAVLNLAVRLARCLQESFPMSPRGDALLVPTNVLEHWYRKFEDKFRRDPDFLLRAPPAPL